MAEQTTTDTTITPTASNLMTPLFAKMGVAALWFTAGFIACMYFNRKRRNPA